jgi:predicted phage terminase large subunit-like protein
METVIPAEPSLELTLAEAIQLAAIDNEFYCTHWFPKTFRQRSPEFHTDVWANLEGGSRFVGLMIFRDGAKTTVTRAFLSKRVAYGVSRTIVILGKSEEAAIKTLSWLRRQVQYNTKWTNAYGLAQGEIWNANHIIIEHKVLGISIQIIAMGILGSVRGINLDDYRPDLIVVDDPCDEENTLTPEARKKLSDSFFGGLRNTLAPATDMPEAMLVLLQTPLHPDDLICQVAKDPEWVCVQYSILDADDKSTWEARHPTETILAEKAAYIHRNQLSIWLREKEVCIVSPEASYFKTEWLDYWEELPEGGIYYLGIDPTPPPRDLGQIHKNLKLDDAVVLVIKVHKGFVYLVDYWTGKSPMPQELSHEFFKYRTNFPIFKAGVETINYQRALKVHLESEMKRRNEYTTLTAIEDKRPKPVRITQTISALASNRKIRIHRTHAKFIEQFTRYPQVSHDDVIDAFAIACSLIVWSMDSVIEGEFTVIESEEEQRLLNNWRR